jgi:amino acid permease
VLTLPYALRGMGWALGLTALSLIAAVTLYEYSLMSRVLDHCEARGRRHIRFRELAADVLGTVINCPTSSTTISVCSFSEV